MKKTLFLIAFIAFNSFATDIVQKNQKICETPEAKAFLGEKGHCSLIPTILEAEDKKGYCLGKLMGTIDCAVVYLKNSKIAGLNIICGNDPQKPLLNKTVEAEFMIFQISAMLNNIDGDSLLINDNSIYTSFRSNIANIVLTTNSQGITVGEFSMNLKGGPVPLTDVTCQ